MILDKRCYDRWRGVLCNKKRCPCRVSLFVSMSMCLVFFFFFQAEDGIRDLTVTGVQTCALPICPPRARARAARGGRRRRATAPRESRTGVADRRARGQRPLGGGPRAGRRSSPRDRKSVV